MVFETFNLDFVPSVGRGAESKPGVSVGENGRITLTRAASKVLEGCTAVQLGYDQKAHLVQIAGVTSIPKGKDNLFIKINWPKKGSPQIANFAASRFLHWIQNEKNSGYDYAEAGNQSYGVTQMDERKHVVVFELPSETPARRPVIVRKRKAKANTVAAPAANAPIEEGEFQTA